MKNIKRAWLHFIGANYYSIEAFRKEALQKGISRAVAPNVLKKMEMGDIVVLAQKVENQTRIFGTFIISGFIGFDHAFIEKATKGKYIQQLEMSGPVKVERGCGSYVVTAQHLINDNSGLMGLIRETPNEELSRTMVTGDLRNLLYRDYVVSEIPFRMGFRRFDWDLFLSKMEEQHKANPTKKTMKIKGYFYVFDSDEPENAVVEHVCPVTDGLLLQIKDYQLN